MISVNDFLEKVQEIVDENPTYRSGGSGDDGTCDCIGLIIGAMRRCGHSRYVIHGSNYFARNQTIDLSGGDPLEEGMIVYKRRSPEESGYDLPAKYREGGSYYDGDLYDYYHVGVVTGVLPTVITHCTSSGGVNGIKIDTKESDIRKWTVCGYVKDVDYEGVEPMEIQAVVIADSGSTVNLRKLPDKSSTVIAKVPIGSTVTVTEHTQDWATVEWNGKHGYMMMEYLAFEEEDEALLDYVVTDDDEEEQTAAAEVDMEVLYRLEEKIDRLLSYFEQAEG